MAGLTGDFIGREEGTKGRGKGGVDLSTRQFSATSFLSTASARWGGKGGKKTEGSRRRDGRGEVEPLRGFHLLLP